MDLNPLLASAGVVLLSVVTIGGIGWAVYSENRRQEQVWEWLVGHYKLKRTVSWGHTALAGSIDGFEVKVWTESRSAGKSSVTYLCIEVAGIPRGLGLQREGLMSSLAKVFGADDIQVGDAAFDAAMQVTGNPVQVAALLDSEARRVTSEGSATVVRENGSVYTEIQSGSPDRVQELLDWTLYVARVIRSPEVSTGERLERIATSDPNRKVRNKALRTLLKRVRGAPTQRMAAKTITSTDPSLRLLAARVLKDVPVLAQLVSDQGAPATRTEALDSLRSMKALTADLQPVLISLLGQADDELRRAAIEALAAVGTVEAVEPLLPLARSGMLAGAQGRAAKAAVQMIQARLHGAEAGGLSLSQMPGEQGGLSVAEPGTEVGALSMADKARRAKVPEG